MRGSTLKLILWFMLLASWCASAYAAEETFDKSLAALPLAAVAVAMALSFVGGLAYTLQKVAKPETVVKNIALEICKDLVTAMVAGLASFFLVAANHAPPLYQALFITIAGYGGSRSLEALFEGTVTRFKAFISPPEVPK